MIEWKLALIYIFTVIILMFVAVVIADSYGQDIDPRYFCIENPFYRSCDQQLQRDKQEIMDIINEVCERDEALCVLGIPDPDVNDTGELKS